MTDPDPAAIGSKLGLVFRVKLRSVRNRMVHAVDEAPIRITITLVLVGIIWLGLYGLFRAIFYQLERTPLEATVAMPMIFNVFFVAMLFLLTLSNAIIAHASLFGRPESLYLLALPMSSLDVVTVKFVESLIISSWSLVVLGLPLMLAMAHEVQGYEFYVLFIAFFLSFIPIPGAVGLLLAWMATRFVSRRTIRVLGVVGGLLLAGMALWGIRSVQTAVPQAEVWLRTFLARFAFLESALLPNQWVSTGIDHALHEEVHESALYLGVTIANALFLSWLVVRFVAGRLDRAMAHAAAGRVGGAIAAAPAAGGPAGWAFFYLPMPLRLVAAKDLRTFFRDPMQWSQLVILFGLLLLYFTNVPTLRLEAFGSRLHLVLPFLNICALSLILATFTCRFVFPLVSLEGQQLWLMGVLPLSRGKILQAKFAFAMTVTGLTAVAATGLSAEMLRLDAPWIVVQLAVTLSVCCGLCGLAVGIGARLPMFDEPSAARIANGMGGTVNLTASMLLVGLVLMGIGLAAWHSRFLSRDSMPEPIAIMYCVGAVLLAVFVGLFSLHMGARHFERVEI